MISRTSIETSLKCPRRYYWNHVYRGGLDARKKALAPTLGIAIHRGLEAVLRGEEDPPGLAVKELQKLWPGVRQFGSDEQQTYLLAESSQLASLLVLAWIRSEWDWFRETYDVISVEEEAETLLSPGVPLYSRWDFAVVERLTGRCFVGNFKSTGSFRDWPRRWEYDIQMWTEAISAENKLGRSIDGVLVLGLNTGDYKDGRRTSPLCYGYRGPEGDWQADYTSRKGWTRQPLWISWTRGADAWLNLLGREKLRSLFFLAPPLFRNDQLVQQWIAQQVRFITDSQHVLEVGSEEEKLVYFRQHFNLWNCGECPFEPICLGRLTIDQALSSGHLVKKGSEGKA